MSHRDLLARAAAALYGEQWQTPLAYDLAEPVAVRTVQRWAAGESPVPLRVLRHLLGALAERRALVGGLAAEIEPLVTCSPEELLAFRDGTLDAEGRRRVEEKLAVDPDAARALADLAAFPEVIPAPGVEPLTAAEVEAAWKRLPE